MVVGQGFYVHRPAAQNTASPARMCLACCSWRHFPTGDAVQQLRRVRALAPLETATSSAYPPALPARGAVVVGAIAILPSSVPSRGPRHSWAHDRLQRIVT